ERRRPRRRHRCARRAATPPPPPTHLHLLVSWQTEQAWNDVRGKIKNLLGTMMSKRLDTFGRPWFVNRASRKQVRDAEHFDYLMATYLPKHHGVKWFEDGRGWC
ncbi:MAG: hypothetical protein WD534_12195, partial [Phycisphaeraceae bacterium]